jgi:NAD(P)-dependent dehydrogenase (short-subunit alcohol dehydrogenase family)
MWDVVISVHLRGTYCVTNAAYNHMKDRGEGGVIINTSSTSGLNGNFGQCNYGAAKAGIAGLTRCLAIEGKKYGIRTFILAPVALTRMTDDLPGFDDEKLKARMSPAVISPLVVYLASDLSKDQTGKTFFVGGGRIAEMKVVTCDGLTKEEKGGLWTPEEIASKMLPGEILMAE